MEYIDGTPLRRRSHRASLPRAFFDGLQGILDGLSLRGVVYFDLRSCKNVLCTRVSDAPALVDLASAYRLPLPRFLIQIWEQYALAKLRARFESFETETASRAEPEVNEAPEELDLGSLKVSFFDCGRLDDPVPTLFLHDVGHCAEGFRPILERATAHARRAIGLNLPGLGGSRWVSRRLALGRVAAHVERLTEALRLVRVDLVGYGWGGLVARTVAARNPSLVRSLLTLDTPLDRLEGSFRKRWQEARRDPELLRLRLLRELPAGLDSDQRTAVGEAIKAASSRTLSEAYGGLRVTRCASRNGRRDLMLRGIPSPPQPWLAVVSKSIEVGQEGSSSAPQSEWWSEPLADPRRLWGALDRLAKSPQASGQVPSSAGLRSHRGGGPKGM
jgi:pimeloyl-ACP methyl ester carboxylesterase